MVIVSITGVMMGTFLLHKVVATAAIYVATAAMYMGLAFMVSSFLGGSRGRVVGCPPGELSCC